MADVMNFIEDGIGGFIEIYHGHLVEGCKDEDMICKPFTSWRKMVDSPKNDPSAQNRVPAWAGCSIFALRLT
jgi:hypothetical protein